MQEREDEIAEIMERLTTLETTVGITRHPEEKKRFDLMYLIVQLHRAVFGDKDLCIRGLQSTMRLVLIIMVINSLALALILAAAYGPDWLVEGIKKIF